MRAWAAAPALPASLVIINLEVMDYDVPGNVELIWGDACDPPPEVSGRRFDLVYSNSTIEHLGGVFQRQRFASVARGLADHHWIQTPYRYFPIEPHWVFPGFQFLPVNVRAQVSSHWPLGQIPHLPDPPKGPTEHLPFVLDVELLSKTELQALFPGSTIVSEPFAGLTKSIIAVL
jgi:hypothetical protein